MWSSLAASTLSSTHRGRETVISSRWFKGFTIALACGLLAFPATSAAAPGGQGYGKPSDGARSLGDPLLPQLGNGGYDAEHYRIELDYDPGANRLDSAETTMIATASQKLREFSLDFQDDLEVSSVEVDGRAAGFSAEEATPDLSDDPDVTQPMKLVVTPHPSTRPKAGREFTVEVQYAGQPQPITDPDTSIEGWINACFPFDPPQTCDGAFVVGEPMGSQSWFPSNNYPTDKATFDTLIRVPNGSTALGVGELAELTEHADGTSTWHWTEDDPTATYLTTATVGDFIFDVGSMVETSTGTTLPVYNAIDATASPAQLAAINASLARAPEQINFLSELYGPYPFDSTGAVADRAAGVGYALEVQTKPHYSGGFTSGDPSIDVGTQLHELAHQWVGNSVTLETWADIWFNEGWANWSEWYWQFLENGGDDPAAIWDDLYATTPAEDWETAPALLDGDPANLFHFFPTYQRGAMTVQGYREIVGDQTFFAFAKAIQSQFGHGNVSTAEFIAAAEEASGFTGARLELLDDYFQQWLYGETRPTIVPDDFGP
ncbi:MAG: M1 family peptidase [Solirubrobacterales bacterium]|nr:M1 family peptidase [Solirubrobacterales bacterium]